MKYEFQYRHSVEEEIEGAPLEAAIEASRAGNRGNQLSKKQGELWNSELLALHYSQALPVSSIE